MKYKAIFAVTMIPKLCNAKKNCNKPKSSFWTEVVLLHQEVKVCIHNWVPLQEWQAKKAQNFFRKC